MRILSLFLILFFSFLSYAQTTTEYTTIDNKIAKIPNDLGKSTTGIAEYITSNFKTDTEKIRAIFYWTVSNMSYDVPRIFAVNCKETSSQEKIENALRTKKGVCIDYSEIFNDISNKVGVECHIIEGYTKQNGAVNKLSHAWCAAKIDGKWFLFDPTWGSGYVNNGKFFKKINDSYFKVEPNKMIATHMPFDYLWQFLNYPITHKEFYEGKILSNKSKAYFDYINEIKNIEVKTDIERTKASVNRMEENSAVNKLVLEYLNNKKKELEYHDKKANIEKLNTIKDDLNQAVGLFNDFIYYRNKGFKPALPYNEINEMIQVPKAKLIKCQNDIYTVGSVGNQNIAYLSSLKKSINDALAQVEEQELFVKKYLSKSKIARKGMFKRVSWF